MELVVLCWKKVFILFLKKKKREKVSKTAWIFHVVFLKQQMQVVLRVWLG